jgi:ornithine cyclodeaminase
MTVPYIGADELAELLPMAAAIDALEETFAGDPIAPARQHLDVPGGELLLMPASAAEGVGVKLVTVAPENVDRGLPLIHGIYVLFAPQTLEPVALFDGAGLTRLRTAAVSGVATRHLAREDATRVVVFGAGVQGHAHDEAMRAVRPITDVEFVDRDSGDPASVERADIVCTCTTSPTPVFQGSLLAPGTHVNAIGAYKRTTRELDDDAISAGRIIVEQREAAFKEAGDLAIPLAEGVISEDQVEELKDVMHGAGRTSDEEITVFKSVGVAFEDLAVAAAAFAVKGNR